jgi:integrase
MALARAPATGLLDGHAYMCLRTRTKRNGVRFVIALALGLRQGEALGLKWRRLHEPSKTLEIMRGLQRQTLAARLRRPARMRRPLSQDQAVPEELQAAPAGLPASLSAGLY